MAAELTVRKELFEEKAGVSQGELVGRAQQLLSSIDVDEDTVKEISIEVLQDGKLTSISYYNFKD